MKQIRGYTGKSVYIDLITCRDMCVGTYVRSYNMHAFGIACPIVYIAILYTSHQLLLPLSLSSFFKDEEKGKGGKKERKKKKPIPRPETKR